MRLPPVSDPMVNIRSTFNAATAAGVIRQSTWSALVGLAKTRFYAERPYRALLVDARREGLASCELDAFTAWLPNGMVDEKLLDARSMLRAMASLART